MAKRNCFKKVITETNYSNVQNEPANCQHHKIKVCCSVRCDWCFSKTITDVERQHVAVILKLQTFALFLFHSSFIQLKMSEAGKSKQIKHKDLSLADKILVIENLKKNIAKCSHKKIWNIAITGVMNS